MKVTQLLLLVSVLIVVCMISSGCKKKYDILKNVQQIVATQMATAKSLEIKLSIANSKLQLGKVVYKKDDTDSNKDNSFSSNTVSTSPNKFNLDDMKADIEQEIAVSKRAFERIDNEIDELERQCQIKISETEVDLANLSIEDQKIFGKTLKTRVRNINKWLDRSRHLHNKLDKVIKNAETFDSKVAVLRNLRDLGEIDQKLGSLIQQGTDVVQDLSTFIKECDETLKQNQQGL